MPVPPNDGAGGAAGRLFGLVVLSCALSLFAVGPVEAQEQGRGAAGPPARVLERRANGEAAVRTLGARLPEVARTNGTTSAALERVLRSDPSAWIDEGGRVLYIDTELPAAAPPAVEHGPYPYTQTFGLHSLPGANRVIYLDFNGHVVSGTSWNDFERVPTAAQPPFDTDGSPGTFSAAEQDIIQSVWQRVAEDFAPFGVDVTTQEPAFEAINRSSTTDTQFGTRALITPGAAAHNAICAGQCGGAAYLGNFDDVPHAYYQPAFVFSHVLSNSAKYIAEAVTHEVGHNLGLSHDGITGGPSYYSGHGSWAPIMGVGYDRPISQWSRGEYSGANNTEDDVAVSASNGAPLRKDDHGGGVATATSMGTGTSLLRTGVITTRTDLDYFTFSQTCSGTTSVTVTPAPTSPNLDVRLRALSSSGSQLGSNDPTSSTSDDDRANGLSASLSLSLSAGTYYLEVDGLGALSPLDTGYSDYGSLGAYSVAVQPCQRVSSVRGVVRDGAGAALSGALVTVEGSGLPATVTDGSGAYAVTVPAGSYTVGVRRMCASAQTRSVAVNGATTADFTLPGSPTCNADQPLWEPTSNVLPLTGDDSSVAVNLPFTYRHEGVDHTTAYVSTNGALNFLGHDSTYVNTAIPNTAAPNATVYAFWDDLDVDGEASVLTATTGSAGNRKFVVEWRNVRLIGDTARRLSFQIVLHENRSERVRMQYRGIDPGTAETGTSATVGTENANGTKGNQVAYNTDLIFDGLSVRPK